jgi:hypothetical protein
MFRSGPRCAAADPPVFCGVVDDLGMKGNSPTGLRGHRMIDEKWDHLRARRNNVRHYRRLLQTELTDLERRFVERRLKEERSAMESLTSSPQQF